MKPRIIVVQETWLAIVEWANAELDQCRKMLEKESTPIDQVPAIRRDIKRLEKLLNLPNQQEEAQ